MFHDIVRWLVQVVGDLGYPGIFIMMALESTFVPIPSEAVMIPAGYLVQQGRMNFAISLVAGVAGGIAGSYFIVKPMRQSFFAIQEIPSHG